MEWINDVLNAITATELSITAIVAIIVAGIKAYKKVMKAINETQEAIQASMNVQVVFSRAYADKNLDNKDIDDIKDALENAMKEGKDMFEAWGSAKEEIVKLYEKSSEKRKR